MSPSQTGSPSESGKRSKRSLQCKSFTVDISYAAKILLEPIFLALQGAEPERVQGALRVL